MDINVIIQNGNVQTRDREILFQDEPVVVLEPQSLSNMLVALGVFKSNTQARQAGRIGDIPPGYSEFKGNKKVFLFVWNPTEP